MSDETTLLPCPWCGEYPKIAEDGGITGPWFCVWHDCPPVEGGKTRHYGESLGCISITTVWFHTEAEAIAAWNTRAELGNGTLTAEQVREAIMSADRWEKPMGDTGMTNTHLIIRDDAWQAIADELNAANGGRECVPHGEWERVSQTQEVRHVFCKCGYELGMDERDSFPFERTRLFAMPNYCQECGRKIRKAVER